MHSLVVTGRSTTVSLKVISAKVTVRFKPQYSHHRLSRFKFLFQIPDLMQSLQIVIAAMKFGRCSNFVPVVSPATGVFWVVSEKIDI
jgi:hypothetical protein